MYPDNLVRQFTNPHVVVGVVMVVVNIGEREVLVRLKALLLDFLVVEIKVEMEVVMEVVMAVEKNVVTVVDAVQFPSSLVPQLKNACVKMFLNNNVEMYLSKNAPLYQNSNVALYQNNNVAQFPRRLQDSSVAMFLGSNVK